MDPAGRDRFVATPLIVRNLGNREYGLYATILGFISYSFSFGIGKILTKYVAEYRASGESDKIGEVVSATFWLSFTLALGGSLIVAGVARYIVTEVLFLPADQQRVGEVGLYLACAAIIVTMLSQTFSSFCRVAPIWTFVLLTKLSGVCLNIGNMALAGSGRHCRTAHLKFIALSLIAIAFAVEAVRNLRNSVSASFPEPRMVNSPKIRIKHHLISGLWQYSFGVRTGMGGSKIGPWLLATFYIVPMTLAIYMHGMVVSATLALFPAFNELLTDTEKFMGAVSKGHQGNVRLHSHVRGYAYLRRSRTIARVDTNQEMAERGYFVLVIQVLTFGLVCDHDHDLAVDRKFPGTAFQYASNIHLDDSCNSAYDPDGRQMEHRRGRRFPFYRGRRNFAADFPS